MLKGTIIGNLGKDAEIKDGKNGSKFYAFSLAHTQKKNDAEETIWISCTYYYHSNNKLLEYLKKGAKVHVYGSLNIGTYNGKADVSCNVSSLELI